MYVKEAFINIHPVKIYAGLISVYSSWQGACTEVRAPLKLSAIPKNNRARKMLQCSWFK